MRECRGKGGSAKGRIKVKRSLYTEKKGGLTNFPLSRGLPERGEGRG